MSQNDRLDRRLTAWLDVEAAPYAPTDLRMRFADGVARTRQRPVWATTERWISMETRAQLGGVPRLVIILVTFGLLAALAAGAIVVGSDRPALADSNGRIAFVYQNDIYTVAPDGTDRQLLVDGVGSMEGVAWSPDGTRLAYWSGRDSGGWKLNVINADGTDPIVVASRDASFSDITGSWFPAWSPDGAKLAFTARTFGGPQTACVDASAVDNNFCSSRVFVAAADGSTGAVRVGDPDLSARTAAWSPNGETIAFGSGDFAKGIGLYVMDADGTDVRRLGDVSGTWWSFMQIAWSPDGNSIASSGGMETFDMWVFASDGSAEKMVFTPEVPTDQGIPAYAPDGVLAWGGGTPELAGTVLLAEGGVPRTLAGFGDPVWSPDGLLIATTTESAPGDLVIIDRDGTLVTTIKDAGDWHSWQRLPG